MGNGPVVLGRSAVHPATAPALAVRAAAVAREADAAVSISRVSKRAVPSIPNVTRFASEEQVMEALRQRLGASAPLPPLVKYAWRLRVTPAKLAEGLMISLDVLERWTAGENPPPGFLKLLETADLPEDVWNLFPHLNDPKVREQLEGVAPIPTAFFETIGYLNAITTPGSPYEQWLKIYHMAPTHIKSKILRGEFDFVPVKAGQQFDSYLSHFQLTGTALAFVLKLSLASVSLYRNGGAFIPGRLLTVLRRNQDKTQILSDLLGMIARATAVYTVRYPYYAQVFKLHRILMEKGIVKGVAGLVGAYSKRLRGREDLTRVLEIVEKDIPLAQMQRELKGLFNKRRALTRVHFFYKDPPNRALREAAQKFGVTHRQIRELFGIGKKQYQNLARGSEPVSERWAPYVAALQEAQSFADLQARVAPLNQEKERTKTVRQEVPYDERVFDNIIRDYSAKLERMIGKRLARYRLNSDANIKDIKQEVLIALDRLLKRGGVLAEEQLIAWFKRVILAKVFDKALEERRVTKTDANFYFSMRDLEKKGELTAERLQQIDPRLTFEEAQSALDKYRYLTVQMSALEVSLREDVEDLDNPPPEE